VNINPDHIGFYRVNYDSENWDMLSTLLVNNHKVSIITLVCLLGLLQRPVEAVFSANDLYFLDHSFPLFTQDFSAADRAGILDDAFSLAR